MNLKPLMKKGTLVASLVIGLTACSSKPKIKEFPKSADAKQEISNLEMALEDSSQTDADVLAPVSYKEAQNSLKEAREMEKENKKEEKILKEVALGQAYLNRANNMSDKNRGKLAEAMLARQAAITAKANTLLSQDFAKMDKKVKEETTKVENDKDDEIKDKKAGFMAGYMALELAAIKQTHLGESRKIIDGAVRNSASTLTPKTLSSVNKKYQEADAFITQNRYNTPEIEARSAEVMDDAKKLEGTVATARGLSSGTSEDTALRMQAEEEKLSKTQSALTEEQKTTETLAASNVEMSKEQKLNAIYEEARSKFSPEEAEVYKQGKNLVIRLRSLEFPKSQAVLKGEDFAILKKVEDVIQSFDKSAVIVEGHTDSTGGKQLNQRLSEQRAEAVKKYLEANSADKITELDSTGYGYEKPLATNKTPQGRAQNRRVDVIIQPVQL